MRGSADPSPARRPGAPPERAVEADLLGLVAEVAGLAAVALVVTGEEGPRLRGHWWRGGAAAPAPDAGALLAEASRGTPGAVSAAAAIEGGGEAVLIGTADPGAGVPAATAAHAMEAFAGLLASRLGLVAAQRRAEEARARMAALVEAGVGLGLESSLDDLLARIVASARTLVGARYAALGVLDATGTQLARFVTAGLSDEERERIGALPRGRGILGVLIRDAAPLRLNHIGDDPRSSGFPPHHPPMDSFLGVPIALRGEAFGNLYLTDKAGGPFTEEDEAIALTLAAQAAVAVDNVRRYERERRRADEIESVTEVARAVLSTLDLDALLPLVARRARRLTGADTVGVALRDGDELVFRYAHGVDALGLEGSSGPADMESLAAALRGSLGAPAVQACALTIADEAAGALVAVGWRPFDEGARRLLETFSSQVAVALANARRVSGEREALRELARREAAAAAEQAAADGLRRTVEAQERERARIARELHDESGQVLTALALHLRALEADVVSDEIRARIAEMRRSLASASAGLRELATRLRPSAVEEHGLADAVEELAAQLRRGGLAVDVDARGAPEGLPVEVQTVVFRVVQESLTNIARHSGAEHASVVLAARRGRLRLVVEDDGRGFDPGAPTERLGIAGIRERVELLGGDLRIESTPGAGTAVVVDIDVA
ncbi:GAF domain-containing sensor histidine kinase [Miltoncostaea marina]|uniref:GAF domain-containing sensor histidine kinase n=1 Tax=Miltoncostaea marina TaxID=2843215 RepID=UPI001C3CE76D|nr:GAF domain-containing sensor histidine kinase [Miltoncostaea marina]